MNFNISIQILTVRFLRFVTNVISSELLYGKRNTCTVLPAVMPRHPRHIT